MVLFVNSSLLAFLYCIHIDIDNFVIFLVFCSLIVRCCVLSAINKSITYLLTYEVGGWCRVFHKLDLVVIILCVQHLSNSNSNSGVQKSGNSVLNLVWNSVIGTNFLFLIKKCRPIADHAVFGLWSCVLIICQQSLRSTAWRSPMCVVCLHKKLIASMVECALTWIREQ